MERTGPSIPEISVRPPRRALGLGAGLLALAGTLVLGGCYIVPAHTAYVAPAPVYVAPSPVYVVPAPAYYGGYYGGYGRRGYRRW